VVTSSREVGQSWASATRSRRPATPRCQWRRLAQVVFIDGGVRVTTIESHLRVWSTNIGAVNQLTPNEQWRTYLSAVPWYCTVSCTVPSSYAAQQVWIADNKLSLERQMFTATREARTDIGRVRVTGTLGRSSSSELEELCDLLAYAHSATCGMYPDRGLEHSCLQWRHVGYYTSSKNRALNDSRAKSMGIFHLVFRNTLPDVRLSLQRIYVYHS